MVTTFAGPGTYIQGDHVLENLYDYIKFIGSSFIVITDDIVKEFVAERFEKGMAGCKSWEFVGYCGESTKAEAERIARIAAIKKADGIIGAGGGKVIDSAKYAAELINLPVVVVPTSASSDAPCSAMSVIYEADGTFVESHRMRRHPDAVLADHTVLAEAPVRLLVAGMGDAFATYYEARACKASGADNFTGGRRTEAGYAIAELCNRLLLKYGEEAKASAEKKVCSEALAMVIEANIYLSGAGFENNGCAIAHAFYSGMTAAVQPLPAMHGELVALGTLVQLELEYIHSGVRADREWKEVVSFYESVGLPMCFTALGISVMRDAALDRLAEIICALPNAKKMPFQVTPEALKKALFRVNK